MRSRIMRVVTTAVFVLAASVGPVVSARANVPCEKPHIKIGGGILVMEQMGLLRFTVTMTASHGCFTGSVWYRTMEQSAIFDATPDVDFESVSGLLDWKADPTAAKYIDVPVYDTGYPEETWDERVGVVLYSESGLTVDNGLGAGKIPSTPWCVIEPVLDRVAPGGACTFPVDRFGEASVLATVTYSTTDGTARAGEDFVGIRDGRQTIPVGGTRADIIVQILPSLPSLPGERDEWFVLQVQVTTGATVETSSATVTIRP